MRYRLSVLATCVVLGWTAVGSAQEIRHGKVVKLDLEQDAVTIAADGTELKLRVQPEMRVFDADRGTVAERFAQVGIKAGAELFFRVNPGTDVLNAVKVGPAPNRPAGRERGAPATPGERVTKDTSHLKPLTELGKGKYQGFTGGLYPDGANERPAAHEAAGLRLAGDVRPLDTDGKPDAETGRIVLLSIGMSNTSQLSQGFEAALRGADDVNPKLLFINGAQGGMTAAAIQDPESHGRGKQYWRVVDERLQALGGSRAQVQAVWIKQADAGPTQGFPAYAKTLQDELQAILNVIHERFPNCKLAYVSSRTYGGFAVTRLNPEPYAYESGFSVKWLIEDQLAGKAELNFDSKKGAVRAPWLSWGPYLWAEGNTPRKADGFAYAPEDFSGDGTHHSQQGQLKGGAALLKFFRTDATTKPWFLKNGS